MLKIFLLSFIFYLLSFIVTAQTWHSVGFNFGNNNSGLDVLKVIDNELYIGGAFAESQGAQLGNGLIKFDGSNWLPLGAGLYGGPYSIEKFNGYIYSVGNFWAANGVPNSKYIARWNGVQWSALPNTTAGQNAQLYSILAFNNSLYLGGRSFFINGNLYNCMAKWNGSSWQQPFSFTGFSPTVLSMIIYNGNLVIGGAFDSVGNVPANNIAMWDGVQWHSLGNGISNAVGEMIVDSVTNFLYCTGETLNIDGKSVLSVGRWDGATWTFIPVYTNGIGALCMFNNDLFVGGSPSHDTIPTDTALVRWDGSQLHHIIGPNNAVSCMAVYQGNLYVGGVFNYVDTIHSPWLACYGNNCPVVNSVAPVKKKENKFVISNSPNPFSGNTTFYYDLPEDVKEACINIISPAGKILQTIQIPVSSGSYEYATNLPSGLYIYSLVLDNQPVYYGKMTILKN